MKIPFYKYHANENDFILIFSNHLDKQININSFINKLCNRSTGIGADGLFIISESTQYDFILNYYNSDGTWETFCANGSRCAASLIINHSNKYKNALFKSGADIHNYKLIDDLNISMSMKIPTYKSEIVSLYGITGFFIDSGARHFVCESDNLNYDYVLKMGRKIRNAKIFAPQGININFYKLHNNGSIQVSTYEKGIEKVMSSCASGSAAVVYHLAKTKKIVSPVTTVSKGGKLIYNFDIHWKTFQSTGPAVLCYQGEFDSKQYIE